MHTLEMRISHIDVNTKNDIQTVEASSTQPWSAINDFRYDRLPRPIKAATNEFNYSLCDGSLSEFPDNTDGLTWGMFGDILSDMRGNYNTLITLRVSFSLPHKSRGLTLHYYSDTGYTLRVTWYSDTNFNDEIISGIYHTEPITGEVNETVSDYRSIEIQFVASNIPNRFIRCFAIDYGLVRVVFDNEINQCNIHEDIDPTSETVSYNTLTVNVRSESSFISPITSPDFDNMLMEMQPIYIFRDDIPFGTYFVNTWEDVHQSGIEFDITADDAISILDRYPHMGGIYIDERVVDLLDEIFLMCFPTGIVTYILDPNFTDATVSGWIPIGTCAFALQHISNALNATVNVARNGDVHLYPREVDAKLDSTITTNDIQPWADIEDLRSHAPPTYLPTLEFDYTLANGELDEFPDEKGSIIYGWISKTKSDEHGRFEVAPKLDIRFGTSRHSLNLELDFGAYEKEYIAEMRLTFFNEHDEVILTKEYAFTQNPATITDRVYGYRRILLEALKTSLPGRYAKIPFISYGRSFYIPLNKQYRDGRDNPTPFISGVRVVSHRFVPNDEESRLFEDVLPLEGDTITFSEPQHSLAITGGSIVDSGANYAVILPHNENNAVTLHGRGYTDNKRTHIVRHGEEAGRIETIVDYDAFTLVSPEIGNKRAQDLFEHLRLPVTVENDVVLDDIETGKIAQIGTRGHDVVGVVQSLDINLRANRARMVGVGDVMARANSR